MKDLLPKIGPEPAIERVKISLPIEDVFSCFETEPDAAFLNSSLMTDQSRFSFIGLDPMIKIKSPSSGEHSKDTILSFNKEDIIIQEDPFDILDELLKIYHVKNNTPFPFIGGGIGYFGYDLKDRLEKLPSTAQDDLYLPDLYFVIYRTVLIHDKNDPEVLHISVLETGGKDRLAAKEVTDRVKKILKNAGNAPEPKSFSRKDRTSLSSNFSKEDYIKAIKKALEYIRNGDIYQVCLSQRFKAEWPLSPYSLYTRLNNINPSPFSAFLNYGDHQIISSSPELFLKISGGFAETRPMKGTRPRGETPEEDLCLKNALNSSIKDSAELLMIVDLERNDLGRTAIPGSIKVEENRRIESHPTVFQTIAVIKSKI
ncbi:MAG: chorismate-binding protein, partial [Candidatus Omnitrophota bacterium]